MPSMTKIVELSGQEPQEKIPLQKIIADFAFEVRDGGGTSTGWKCEAGVLTVTVAQWKTLLFYMLLTSVCCQAGRGSGGSCGRRSKTQVHPNRKMLRKPCARKRPLKVVKTIAKQAIFSAKCFRQKTLPPFASVQWGPKEGLLVYPHQVKFAKCKPLSLVIVQS